jgi:hypothetical protein
MAPRIFFRTPLTCPYCGTLNEARKIQLSSALGNDPEWTSAVPGEAMDAGLGDFEVTFLTLRLPDGATFFAIEQWTCQSCRLGPFARLAFRIRTPRVAQFVDAEVVPLLTSEVLDAVHFMTREIEYWTPLPGEDEARIEELKRKL